MQYCCLYQKSKQVYNSLTLRKQQTPQQGRLRQKHSSSSKNSFSYSEGWRKTADVQCLPDSQLITQSIHTQLEFLRATIRAYIDI